MSTSLMTFGSEIFRHMQHSLSAQMSTCVNIILDFLAFFNFFKTHSLSFRDMFTNLIIQKKNKFSTHERIKNSFGMLPWSLSCHSHIAPYP